MTTRNRKHCDITNKTAEQSSNDNQKQEGSFQATRKPSKSSISCSFRCVGFSFLYITLGIFSFLVFVAPLIIKVFPHIPKHMIYLNAIKIPVNVDLSDPSSVGLPFARSFLLHVEDGIDVGVWHILPKSLHSDKYKEGQNFDELLSHGEPIILYCHGNTGTRGTEHRVILYKVLLQHNFHVIALDYRGFGDSSGTPVSENGVVKDVVHTYKWILERAGSNIPIYIWGHSLGTGIASKSARVLIEEQALRPAGLILESPFNNVYDAAMHHPFSTLFKMFWWFDDLFIQGMHDTGIYLQSDEHILHTDVPVLIMHAEDDHIVPYSLGVKLYEASKGRPKSFPAVVFHTFTSDRGFLHKWICTAPELPDIIRKFMAETQPNRLEEKELN